jgi:Kef-type K+ transport system membrane component KefB
MFCVGVELPLAVLRRHWVKSLAISLTGIIVPFGLGAAASVAVFREFPSKAGSFSSTLLFCGVVTSITAFPVLARILTELRIMGTGAGCECGRGGGSKL